MKGQLTLAKPSPLKSGTSAFMALLMSVTSLAPLATLAPAVAQLPPPPLPRTSVIAAGSLVVPAGTQIPVSFQKAQKILVTNQETLPLTLQVAATITDANGTVLIPRGSQIAGRIEPAGTGSRFVAQTLILSQQEQIPINATSAVVTTTETIKEGASAGEIVGGTLAGAGAATLIAGVTGDRKIDALEVLGGAAVGALAGWLLPEAGVIGGGSKTVIAIDPNRDLTLTVQSDLFVD